MTDEEWFKAFDQIFNPKSNSVSDLRKAVERASREQMREFEHFIANNRGWNDSADPGDLQDVADRLQELQAMASTKARSAVLGALLNNLPAVTQKDVAKLSGRIRAAKLGLHVNDYLDQRKAEIVQRVTELPGKPIQGYHPMRRQRALMRVAVQSGEKDVSLTTIFRHMQALSIDLDRVIDYQVQNHMNPHSLKKAASEALKGDQLKNLGSEGWRTQAQRAYMHTKSNVERIFVTEAKTTQIKAAGKKFQNDGYDAVKVLTRHNSHVCPFCAGMDETIVKITDMTIGVNVPPFHPRCACNIVPVETD